MRRTGFGRHGGHGDQEDDPLDGLVNLFDLGLVLAVAFLVAGLTAGRSIAQHEGAAASTPTRTQPVEIPAGAGRASGSHGDALGTVYRLPDGTLVLDEGRGTTLPPRSTR